MSYAEDFQRDIATEAANLGVRATADKHSLPVSTVSRWAAEYGQAQKALIAEAVRQERLNARRDTILERLLDATESAAELANEALTRARDKKASARDVLDLTRAAAIALDKAGVVAFKAQAAGWQPPVIEAEATVVDPFTLDMPATEKESA